MIKNIIKNLMGTNTNSNTIKVEVFTELCCSNEQQIRIYDFDEDEVVFNGTTITLLKYGKFNNKSVVSWNIAGDIIELGIKEGFN